MWVPSPNRYPGGLIGWLCIYEEGLSIRFSLDRQNKHPYFHFDYLDCLTGYLNSLYDCPVDTLWLCDQFTLGATSSA